MTTENQSTKRRILLVDDHPIVRQGLRRLIDDQSDLVVCGEAETTVKAVELTESLKPDLAIVDLSLNQGDGLELTKQLRSLNYKLVVLVLSMHDESLYAERALRAGAAGYVMKQAPQDEVMNAIRQVLRGETYLSQKMTAKLLRGIRGGQPAADVSPLNRLTDREMQVFRLIGQGHGVSAIADTLYLSPRTVESHKEHIKTKLNLNNNAELLQYAIEARRPNS